MALRTRIAVTSLILMVASLAALFIITSIGQARLRNAGEQLEQSSARQLRIADLDSALIRAVNAQRSLLLTGDKIYLARYEKSRAQVEPRLERLRLAYASSKEGGMDIRNLQILVGKRLADLAIVSDLQQKQGTAAAVTLIQTSVGSDAALAIQDILDEMRKREITEHDNASREWSASLGLSRWITPACIFVNILLLALGARAIHIDSRRRATMEAAVNP